MNSVYVSKKVETCIEAFKKNGRAGTNLANKAEGIIENLALCSGQQQKDTICTLTKHGEKRIKNCLKYDLGGGFRMITLQQGSDIFIPFMGSHDECQRWLENNRSVKKITAGKGTIIHLSGKGSTEYDSSYGSPEVFYEDEILVNLDDRYLRIVFSGLIEGAKKNPGNK